MKSALLITMQNAKYIIRSARSRTNSTMAVPHSEDSYFGAGSSFNRFSFLRGNNEFIKSALASEECTPKLIFFDRVNNDFAPLFSSKLKRLITLDLKGNDLLCETLADWEKLNAAKDSNLRKEITPVFLGMDEYADSPLARENLMTDSFQIYRTNADNQNVFDPAPGIDKLLTYKHYSGIPYFAINISNSQKLKDYLYGVALPNGEKLEPATNRMDVFQIPNNEATLFSYAKMYIDWLHKNQFCPGCGARVIPVEAGTRLLCTSPVEQKCPVKSTTVNNVCFPRTDPVIISLITNTERTKILLACSKRHYKKDQPKQLYSCIAGFMEPGETVEHATIREIWEETGIKASYVQVLKSQPWPYPANLMIGCCGYVEFNGTNEKIDLTHDNELADAVWVDVEVLKEILASDTLSGPPGSGLEHVQIPWKEAIANRLIDMVVNERFQRL